ncbi:hypothetical protein [Microlunatus antarcticus]|uniref:Uncharacterized protein n=1 Tax=Microlunatus antarcticus TaxID=53388 RepID=A0A7W5P570_9ACTN|nr:hypothetical protein [Microlunatus antarcticus]MBB3325129.1 hypothetical protein [Microlunatus antarcticus]
MTTITRDPWADAGAVATQTVLDDELAAVRRRVGLRHALVTALELGAVVAASALVNHLVDPRSDPLWTVPRQTMHAASGLEGVGFVLVFVGLARRGGAGRRFIDATNFLPRSERRWLRTQITEQRPVPEERRVVVADTARRMVAEGRFTPGYLGWLLISVGTIIDGPAPASLVLFSALALVVSVHGVRELVCGRRARRWLRQHG